MRCKLCDNALRSSEIIWYPEQQRHEDLCVKCRQKVGQDVIEAGWQDDIVIPTETGVADYEEG